MRSTLAIVPLFFAAALFAQETQPEEKPAVDLSSPTSALTSYLEATKGMDAASLKKIITITNASKQGYADIVQNYLLWEQYLERKAVAKYGPDEGIIVLSHVRSLDDQNDLDMKRVRTATIQYSSDRKEASVFLRVEHDRPGGLATDRFHFLDRYDFVKTADGWKLNFLKTYDCEDAEKENTYRVELGVFPRMAKFMKDLAADIKEGRVTSAGDAKQRLEDAWQKAYDDNLAPGVPGSQPAN